jgi:hypothetical protein
MEQNKVIIDLERYDELLLQESQLQLAKQIIFNQNNCLYQGKDVVFSIDGNQVKLVFSMDYHLHLIGLQKKEGENV